MSNNREHEPICPECGSADIKSLGYNYDLAKVFYECQDCETQADSSYFDPEEEEND
jgi:tRNA(Ile2) C34 agmatinyltransferase TiaS